MSSFRPLERLPPAVLPVANAGPGGPRQRPAPLRTQPVEVLPARDGDPSFASSFVPSEAQSASEILRCAETLGIPWKRILVGEIEVEQRLRRYLPDVEGDIPMPSVLTVLSFSLLQSWRVRDQIQVLSCQARGASSRGAARKLRTVFQRLAGKADRDQAALAEHFWFAYQRILLLQRVRRAAVTSQGTLPERLAFICSRTRCSFDDAAWAVCQEDSPVRGRRVEAAVAKVREEGFLIPRARTEALSLEKLRRIVLVSPLRTRRRPCPSQISDSVSAPRRVPLPVDAL